MAFAKAHALYSARKYREAYDAFHMEQSKLCGRYLASKHKDLLDEICLHSAALGDVIGFSGRVQPADPGAVWLGAAKAPPAAPSSHTSDRQCIYSSIAEALEVADDGDVVQLLPGTHVVSQMTLSITKRVLIEGRGGSAEEVVLDHRANHPAFVITRSCILRHFSIDMVGFCEAIAVSADTTAVKPYLQDLVIACSGDDGMCVAGGAQPLLQHCKFQVSRL
eukprot:gene2804-3097_t